MLYVSSLAGCLGFEGIKAEATGMFSRKAFATIGMLPVAHIRCVGFLVFMPLMYVTVMLVGNLPSLAGLPMDGVLHSEFFFFVG
jgi:hypothetical protein